MEPLAPDRIEDNFHPVGRPYHSGSTFLCVPDAPSWQGGHALGAQAGEAAVREVATEARLTRFRRAARTPVNVVCEIRPRTADRGP
ncbi:hypothetical protein [Streptomyces sp. NPDC052721]|uniref:hypothetical protein n=1 Tax=Streptomyces sp. NPDC052721 TaxID=3154955 RepID=UPI0034299768